MSKFNFKIPGPEQETSITIEPGSSAVFVGANGSGKTRLAVYVEEMQGERAHRISAHRALNLNPGVFKIPGEKALNSLRYGDEGSSIAYRSNHRWGGGGSKAAVMLLDDFDSLVQALFADQAIITLDTHRKSRSGTLTTAKATKFETLSQIWQRLLPHCELVITGDDIQVRIEDEQETYPASEMSDGERAIFYLIAQALVADESSLLIIDEPELHVHPSIMSNLWDEIETARKDCAFLFITHDLNFAAARAAQKYVIHSYYPTPAWSIASVPEDSGFSEEVATLILGSRQPILFVEGNANSLDISIYRCCYPEWTVISCGSCKQVVHAVSTMRSNEQFTRIVCAGVVDADDRSGGEIRYLNAKNVFPLPVSEIENLILLPEVSREIAQLEGYTNAEIEEVLSSLKKAVFDTLQEPAAIEGVVVRYCCRRIDRAMKRIDLSESKDIDELEVEYQTQTSSLNIKNLADGAKQKIEQALQSGDLAELLTIYDHKGLVALAAKHLKGTRKSTFEAWLTRMLRDEEKAPDLISTIKAILPVVQTDGDI